MLLARVIAQASVDPQDPDDAVEIAAPTVVQTTTTARASSPSIVAGLSEYGDDSDDSDDISSDLSSSGDESTMVPTATAARASVAPTAVPTATTTPSTAIALAYRLGWTAGHDSKEHDTVGVEIALFEGEVRPAARRQQDGAGPSRYEVGFEDGFRDGVQVRTAPLRAQPPPPVSRPPPSVLYGLLGHVNWLMSHTTPGTHEFDVAVMSRDWLHSL